MKRLILYFFLIFCIWACRHDQEVKVVFDDNSYSVFPFAKNGIYEIKKGDILVRPNANFLPGTSSIPNGLNFGHAALVSKGFSHHNIDTLLMNVTIIESIASDVPSHYQVRVGYALNYNENKIERCVSFSYKFSGARYLLRPNISESAIDSIIDFALQQRGDLSNWNAMKRFPENDDIFDSLKTSWADNHNWYCSLLVWQSIFYVTGIDLDINVGYQVYPNDLIAHPFFDNSAHFIARYRF